MTKYEQNIRNYAVDIAFEQYGCTVSEEIAMNEFGRIAQLMAREVNDAFVIGFSCSDKVKLIDIQKKLGFIPED